MSTDHAARAARTLRTQLATSSGAGDTRVEVVNYANKTIVVLGGMLSNDQLANARQTLMAQSGDFEVAAL